MVYTGSAGVETTYYATPLFEAVYTGGVTDFRHYIYAGSRPVGVISRTTAGAINVRSLLVDHQGSISSIVTDATGAALVSESFTAYGNRREASTWSGAPTGAELTSMNGVTREGYTFQTVLGSMGLNHMNGRIEDSVTGRFLSPDPRGLIRGNTQSWNRYSYVNNNPLSRTDPTGFMEVVGCDDDGTCGGGGGGFDVGPIDPGPVPALPPIAPTPDTYTGSNIPGVNMGIGTCTGSCDGYNQASFGSMGGSSNAASGGAAGATSPGAPAAVADSLAQSQDPLSPIVVTAQSQNQVQTGNDGLQEIVVTAQSTAQNVSAGAGWAGIAAGAGDPLSGTASLGTNLRFYSAPRGNQYFSTLTKLSTVFKITGVGAVVVGGLADYYDASQTGSYFQANLNTGIGAAGLLLPPLALPGSLYFIASTYYPGGPEAYNQAFSDAINAGGGGP
jgi:RHS repeat-associated protein